jgi:hypothetical protein
LVRGSGTGGQVKMSAGCYFLAGGTEPAISGASVYLGLFMFGPNTLWLGLRGFLIFIIWCFEVFLFGAIFFTKNLEAKAVRRLTISAARLERCY